jgi:hypothetical protein
MVSARLEVRLDPEYKQKLDEVVRMRGTPVSALVREMIDRLYDDAWREKRHAAALRLVGMEIEDVPDPDELSRQLDERRGRYPDLY